ncbi:MAG: RecX family transcriptional regulator [Anaerolineae bacterium]|nr:RecX family transcriptional regulator [Anaerolineae bacterium]MDW8098597.1 RecX family transcriptional regulator [Anaerolineae bacterium]
MPGRITALRFQKRNRERVNVYLDGRFAFTLPAVAAAQLRKGQELSDTEIEHLQTLDAEAKAYERALRFLGYRPRSEAEVRCHLQRHRVDLQMVDRVIERLRSAGYLDDRAFARFWVENRRQFNPRSAQAIQQELLRKGVASELIEEALQHEHNDEEEIAYQLLSSRVYRWRGLDRATFWRKGGGYLARRGFAYEVIEPALRRMWAQLQADRRPLDEG